MSDVAEAYRPEQAEEVKEAAVSTELDEGKLRQAVVKMFPGGDEFMLKIVPLWNRDNIHRVRANWYEGGMACAIISKSKFLHATVLPDGGLTLKDKTILPPPITPSF